MKHCRTIRRTAHKLPLAAVLACFILSSSAFSQDNSLIKQSISLATYFSSGDYGESMDTEILYFPVSYSANRGKWGAQLTLAHLQVEGVGNVLVNVGGVGRAVAGTQLETNSGMGDSTLALTYQMDPLSDTSPFIDLRLNVKFPTADREKGLGSGEVDYSAQVDISQNYGSSVLFGSLGYTFRGKTELYAGLDDSAFVQLGIARPLDQKWNIGFFYDFREPASTFSPEIHELVPYLSYQISDRWSFTGLAAFGFTDASAGTAVLGQLSYSW